MKRKEMLAWLLLAALLAAGCEAKTPAAAPEPAPAPGTEQTVAEKPADAGTEPKPEPEPADDLAVYAPVLDEACDLIYNGIREDETYGYCSTGLMEAVMYTERAELLKTVGYTIEDINGDGVSELLIGALPGGEPYEQAVYGGYTCKDGEPVRFLEGWARNRYYWLGGARFYNLGSGGAMNTIFGTFRLPSDAAEMTCEDCYFTEELASEQKLAYFYNTTGACDVSASERLECGDDEFWQIRDGFEAERKTLALTPFADYAYTGFVNQPLDCKVRVDYLDDAAYKYSYYDDASAYLPAGETEFETTLLFQSDEGARDFKLLALTLRDVDADGHAAFDTAEVFNIPALRAGIPLAVPMSFPGDIPSNGFSYTDADGATKAFSVGMSGRDGSLIVTPLD